MHPLLGSRHILCVDDKPLPGHAPPEGVPWLRAGRVYRVQALSKTPGETDAQYGVRLAEGPIPPSGDGWRADRFRKIERADDSFTDLLRTIGADISFRRAVRETAEWHSRRWAVAQPEGCRLGQREARVSHVERLLLCYCVWFRGVFACYPDSEHLRAVASCMTTWRRAPTAETRTMNPWVMPAEYPAICRTAFSDRTANEGGKHAA